MKKELKLNVGDQVEDPWGNIYTVKTITPAVYRYDLQRDTDKAGLILFSDNNKTLEEYKKIDKNESESK